MKRMIRSNTPKIKTIVTLVAALITGVVAEGRIAQFWTEMPHKPGISMILSN